MTFVISADDETFKSYPFEFVFKVKFSLCGKSLKIDYIAENVGEEEMYFGLGAHPDLTFRLKEENSRITKLFSMPRVRRKKFCLPKII